MRATSPVPSIPISREVVAFISWSQPEPILIALSVPAPAVMPSISKAFKVPAPTPVAMAWKILCVPPVVNVPFAARTPVTAKVAPVCVPLGMVISRPRQAKVPAVL